MSDKILRTTTISAKGWDRNVDIADDLYPVFSPNEDVVVILESEYERLKVFHGRWSTYVAPMERELFGPIGTGGTTPVEE